MAHGDLIWCDLSAYDPPVARAFYSDLLGWLWTKDESGDLAMLGGTPVASVYQMPPKFIDMNMPSFWMSYMAVDSAADTATQAQALGGKVELGPVPFQDGGEFALIRDPLGAGFTVVDNPLAPGASHGPGARVGHALFVSDVSAITAFYSKLFGWEFLKPANGVYPVHHHGKRLFHCHEIPDPELRGKKQYWSVLFSCEDAREAIETCGGSVLASFDLPEGVVTLAEDPQRAVFMTVEAQHA